MLTHNREPPEIATLNVEGKAFKVYKAILIKDSDYFERALNGSFAEAQTQTIAFEEGITSAELSIYLDVVHRSYFDEKYKFRHHFQRISQRTARSQSLWLWKLSDRFLNKRTLKIAEEAVEFYWQVFSIARWESRYKGTRRTDEELRRFVMHLQNCYKYCVEHSIPYQEDMVTSAANMPMQLLAKHQNELDVEYLKDILTKVAKRFENPTLKRPHSPDNGSSEQVNENSRPTKRT